MVSIPTSVPSLLSGEGGLLVAPDTIPFSTTSAERASPTMSTRELSAWNFILPNTRQGDFLSTAT